jgi:hypothetical protein
MLEHLEGAKTTTQKPELPFSPRVTNIAKSYHFCQELDKDYNYLYVFALSDDYS